MNDLRNGLLLAALKRAGKPLDSGDLLDTAVALALDEGWSTESLADLNRARVSKRLGDMEREGKVKQCGVVKDERARRDTPIYEPRDGWDSHAAIPLPQRNENRKPSASPAKQSPFADYDKRELMVIVEGQDQIIQSYRRMQELIGLGMKDVSETVEKVRARFLAEGLRSR